MIRKTAGIYLAFALLVYMLIGALPRAEACENYTTISNGETEMFYITDYKAGDTLYCTASAGLRVRSSPKLDGKRVASLPFNTKVTVLDVQPKLQKIGVFESCWFQISFEQAGVSATQGWVYGAYLQAFEANSEEEKLLEQ